MVETAYQGQFNDFALFGRFNRTRFRAILVQRSVRPRFMIKGLVLGQDVVQLLLVKDDHLIQAFTTNRADQPFDHWILPRTAGRDELLFQTKILDPINKVGTIDGVAIPEQIPRRSREGEGFEQLPSGPIGRG